MSLVSFITGGMTVIMAYAFYSVGIDDEEDELGVEENNVVVNDFSGRYVTLSCQSCRKLKRHKEVEPNLFQCTKCKRNVDIRLS
jgi:NAD-dependent SIR2 family protein deacetylase